LAVDLARRTITLSPTPDAVLPGNYSFWFDDDSGHARLGEVVERAAGRVVRRLLSVDFGDMAHARRGRMNGWFYLNPGELGFDYESVQVQTELGPAPAWLIPAAAASQRWVIHVHGRATTRSEALRAVPVFREAGYTSLIISYRNDGEAPGSADNRYALGDTEWRDVEAALRFAADRGAKDVVLMGWSMGGATVLQAVTRSELAGVVRGLVLDSPVIDWVSALSYQGDEMRLPRGISQAAIALLGRSWARWLTGQHQPIDVARLDFIRRAGELTVPILLMHSDDDGFIPSAASRALAEARTDIVSFESFRGARHTKLWNYDPDRWNAVITAWLEKLQPTSGRKGCSIRQPKAGPAQPASP
jgi:alpha-beta hydrolase superfamily lysophospholipase